MTGEPVFVALGKQSARLSGPGVLAAIEATGAPRMRDAARKAWLVPLARIDDVMAHLEHVQRRRIELIDEWPEMAAESEGTA